MAVLFLFVFFVLSFAFLCGRLEKTGLPGENHRIAANH
jgi:hypothetical protein